MLRSAREHQSGLGFNSAVDAFPFGIFRLSIPFLGGPNEVLVYHPRQPTINIKNLGIFLIPPEDTKPGWLYSVVFCGVMPLEMRLYWC